MGVEQVLLFLAGCCYACYMLFVSFSCGIRKRLSLKRILKMSPHLSANVAHPRDAIFFLVN